MNLGAFGFGSSSGGGSSAITGAGIVPKIPKFTAASVIGDSQMSDNGTTVFIGASATSAKAAFEVNSTTKGVFLPRVTTTQQTAIGAGATDTSLLMFNTTNNRYEFYNHADTSYKRLLIPEDIGNITVLLTTTTSSHTGNMTETIVYSDEIEAGTFTTNDKIYQELLLTAIGLNGVKTIRTYLNTSNDLSGSPVLISTYFTNNLLYSLSSSFFINSTTSMKSYKGATTNLATSWGSRNGDLGTYSIDFTVTQYYIVAVELASAADVIQLEAALLNRNRL